MLIAITSDIHNNLANLKKVLDYCTSKKIDTMICCGDLASIETLDFLNDNFSGEIFYCFGNMDDGQMTSLQRGHPEQSEGSQINSNSAPNNGIPRSARNNIEKYKNTIIFKKHGEIKIENKSIAFVHYPDVAKKLAESGKYDFVFYGHTHKPWVAFAPEFTNTPKDKKASTDREQKKCIMLNPGNIANEIYPPTFAVWDTKNDKFKLIRINNLK